VVTTFLSDRRKTRRRGTTPTSDPAVLERVEPNHEAIADRDEIERMLAVLSPQQKVAVVMRYLLDQDDEQIAHVLDCAPATVRSHLSHARAALRLSANTRSGRE
jgi:RNA polymerase sigma factor (sigma-70 family)